MDTNKAKLKRWLMLKMKNCSQRRFRHKVYTFESFWQEYRQALREGKKYYILEAKETKSGKDELYEIPRRKYASKTNDAKNRLIEQGFTPTTIVSGLNTRRKGSNVWLTITGLGLDMEDENDVWKIEQGMGHRYKSQGYELVIGVKYNEVQ